MILKPFSINHYFCLTEANRTVLERLNASRTIITALLHHEDADKIHENGLIALTNLSAESKKVQNIELSFFVNYRKTQGTWY